VKKIVTAMMILALAMPAYAQAPAINLSGGGATKKTDVEIQREKEAESGYKSGLSKIPDAKGKTDPWGTVRSGAAPQANKNAQAPNSK
jgi:hypothetical protein